MYTAWIIPGIYPRQVKRMFKKNAPLHPTLRKTPKGGKKMARMISRILATAILMREKHGGIALFIYPVICLLAILPLVYGFPSLVLIMLPDYQLEAMATAEMVLNFPMETMHFGRWWFDEKSQIKIIDFFDNLVVFLEFRSWISVIFGSRPVASGSVSGSVSGFRQWSLPNVVCSGSGTGFTRDQTLTKVPSVIFRTSKKLQLSHFKPPCRTCP